MEAAECLRLPSILPPSESRRKRNGWRQPSVYACYQPSRQAFTTYKRVMHVAGLLQALCCQQVSDEPDARGSDHRAFERPARICQLINRYMYYEKRVRTTL